LRSGARWRHLQPSLSATVPQAATVKTVKQGTEKQTAPSATQTTPVSERTYEGCHHSKDSDA